MDEIKKRTWAEISLTNIEHNYRAVREILPEGCKYLGVVKANAYGHGAIPVARRLEQCGADYLAVACLDEALELRDNGIGLPILILGCTHPRFTAQLIENDITICVPEAKLAEEYSKEAAAAGGTLKVHIKLDTGMSRLGFLCDEKNFDDSVREVIRICGLPGLKAEGVFTHFAVSDIPGSVSCREYTLLQYNRFIRFIGAVREVGGVTFDIRHCSNSGGTLYYPELILDMVRPGLTLYGYGDEAGQFGLKPAMRVATAIDTVKYLEPGVTVSYGRRFEVKRRTRMGVIPIGYADGLSRALMNKCSFITEFGRVPQCGTICMDMCMVDLTDVPEAEAGTEVEIFGEKNRLEELAKSAGTITYELLCGISPRVPRVYGG